MNRRLLTMLAMMGALTALSIDIYLPSMPALTVALGTDMQRVRQSLNVFMLSFALGQLLVGPISDRFGRRLPLLTGLGIYLAANLTAAAATNIEVLIAARFFQGMGACCGGVIASAIVRDLSQGREMTRALAHVSTAVALAPITAPMLGAWLDRQFGWRASFLFLSFFSLLLWVWVAKAMPETLKVKRDMPWRNMPLAYWQVLKHGRFLTFSAVNAFGFGAIFAFISTASPLLIEGFEVSVSVFGVLFASNAVLYMAGSFLAGKLAKALEPPVLAFLGGIIVLTSGLAMVSFAANGSIWGVMIPMYLATLGGALAMPAGTAGGLAPFGMSAGSASGMQGFLRFGISTLIGLVLGMWSHLSSLPLAFAISVCGALCTGAAAVARFRFFSNRARDLGKPCPGAPALAGSA